MSSVIRHLTKNAIETALLYQELCYFASCFLFPDQELRSWELATSRQMHLIHIKANQWSLSPTSKCHSGKTQEDELSQAEGREEGECEVENLEWDDGCDLITG